MKTGTGKGHPNAGNVHEHKLQSVHKQGYGTRSRPWTPSSSPQLTAGNSGLPHRPRPVPPPAGRGKQYQVMNLPPEGEEDTGVSQLKGISSCSDKLPVQLGCFKRCETFLSKLTSYKTTASMSTAAKGADIRGVCYSCVFL